MLHWYFKQFLKYAKIKWIKQFFFLPMGNGNIALPWPTARLTTLCLCRESFSPSWPLVHRRWSALSALWTKRQNLKLRTTTPGSTSSSWLWLEPWPVSYVQKKSASDVSNVWWWTFHWLNPSVFDEFSAQRFLLLALNTVGPMSRHRHSSSHLRPGLAVQLSSPPVRHPSETPAGDETWCFP